MGRPGKIIGIPPDVFLARLEELGWNRSAYARELRVAVQSVGRRARDLGAPYPENRAVQRLPRRQMFEQALAELALLRTEQASLRARVDALEARPVGLVEWRPDHRRLKDGGTNVQRQRKAVGLRRPRRIAETA